MEREWNGRLYIAVDPEDDPRVSCFVQIQDEQGERITDGFGETITEAFDNAVPDRKLMMKSSARTTAITVQRALDQAEARMNR